MALSHLVVQYESNFCTVALQFIEEEKNYALPSPATTGMASSPVNPQSTSPGGSSAGRGPVSELLAACSPLQSLSAGFSDTCRKGSLFFSSF